MNEVPLIQEVRKNDINTSIIAIKKQLKQLIEAVGLIESPNAPDLSPYVKKTDITDVVEVGNTNPVTSNGVALAIEESIAENIVDVVENDNLKAVTSNAVAECFDCGLVEVSSGVGSVTFSFNHTTPPTSIILTPLTTQNAHRIASVTGTPTASGFSLQMSNEAGVPTASGNCYWLAVWNHN